MHIGRTGAKLLLRDPLIKRTFSLTEPRWRSRWTRQLLLLMLAVALGAGAEAQTGAGTSEEARKAWGFDRSDLAPHAGVRFGVLGNGMRYAVMRNASPAGGFAARLRVDVGATAEGTREQGFVHLIEHLIFQESMSFPAGALPLMLAHQGLKRLEDFNAFTSYDETVYRLDLAKSDARSRETALNVMREIADRLAFTRGAVAGVKKQVLAEIDARDATQDRVAAAQNQFLLPGTPLARGPVAGSSASVRRADAAALRRLYEIYYVPRRTVLVLVGDFDPAVAEAEIVRHFADWRADTAQTAPAPPPAIAGRHGVEARLFVGRAAPTSVSIASVESVGEASDRGVKRDANFLERLGSEMLNRRLAALAARPGAPIAGGEAAIYTHFSTARLASVDLAARDRDWRGALQAGARELRRATEGGFTQAELDAQITASRAALARDAGARTSPELADAIVDAAGRGIVFTEPADPAASAAYLARIRLEDVNAAFRAAWASGARLIFVSHSRRIAGGERAVLDAWTQTRSMAASEPTPNSPQR